MRICNRYPGANPRRASDVEKLAPNRFLLRPWSEDGDGNYKFCLNVEAINETGKPQDLKLLVDWDDLEYMSCRDYIMVGRDEQWTSFPGKLDGMISELDVVVPPGDWYLGMHPVYDFEHFEADCRIAVDAGFESFEFGKTGDRRAMTALSAGNPGGLPVLIVSRFHPYETAGSFCVSEMLSVVAADLAADGPLTAKFRFVVVPMTNPDGVAAGCCKRSRPKGPDLCHQGADSDDPAGEALAQLLAEIKPHGYLDIHGWMYRDHDGLCYSHPEKRDAFAAALAGEALFNKEWKGSDWSQKPDQPGDFYMRATRDHNAIAFVISPSWFGRTVPEMREYGRKLFGAFCGVL
jgi:hypothetical protein